MHLISVKLPHTQVEEAILLLDQYFQSLSCFEDESALPSDMLDDNGFPVSSQFIMHIFLQDPTYGDLICALLDSAEIPFHHFNTEKIVDQDWLKVCYENFKPLTVGRFFIHSSYAPQPVPTGSIGLMIDAATAFGSGEHQTTRGCLQAIDTIIERIQVQHILDVG
ncbi:MAG: 50S ribosomal protein L11 methyltransferase, partial [Alphaproteobacteria bacterium]|nr:50S ribosomal protein L11 methyltransferase [Alphaproteobacteria bacterium]